jgi:hypothetical protein
MLGPVAPLTRRPWAAWQSGHSRRPPSSKRCRWLGLSPSPKPFHYYGLRAYKRVRSIAGGSNVLQLTEASRLKVGDQVIAEVGGERGKARKRCIYCARSFAQGAIRSGLPSCSSIAGMATANTSEHHLSRARYFDRLREVGDLVDPQMVHQHGGP